MQGRIVCHSGDTMTIWSERFDRAFSPEERKMDIAIHDLLNMKWSKMNNFREIPWKL